MLASGVVLGLMLLGGALSRRPAGRTVAGLATAGTLGVLALGYQTGEAGGHLVYTHGAAQAYQGTNFQKDMPAVAATGEDDDD